VGWRRHLRNSLCDALEVGETQRVTVRFFSFADRTSKMAAHSVLHRHGTYLHMCRAAPVRWPGNTHRLALLRGCRRPFILPLPSSRYGLDYISFYRLPSLSLSPLPPSPFYSSSHLLHFILSKTHFQLSSPHRPTSILNCRLSYVRFWHTSVTTTILLDLRLILSPLKSKWQAAF
jgi:hypothetical protein